MKVKKHIKNAVDDVMDKYLGDNLSGFVITNYSNNIVLIEGHIGLLEFESEYVNFRLPVGSVKLSGKNIKIKEYDNETAIVSGEAMCVSVNNE